MRNLLRNLHYGVRGLLRNPGLTFTVLLTLALGIGATTAIFTIDYASLIADTPFPNPDQLVVVWSKVNGHPNGVSAGDYLDWSRQNTTFKDLKAVAEGEFNISSKDQPISVEGARYTPGYYTMLGSPFAMGRDFLPEEGQAGKDQVVILTHKLWQRLGADPHIIGKTMSIDGSPRTVIGITAPGQADRAPAQVCVPLVFKPEQINHDFHWLLVMGRLKPGVTIKQAQADMDNVTAHIAQAYPKSNHGWGAAVDPEKLEWVPKETQLILWLLLGAVGFVLLIACANVANLLLGRSMSRQKEMAIRSSLGATPAMIFEQLLTENLLLAFLGGALGIALGYALLQGVLALMPRGTLPTEADLRINLPILVLRHRRYDAHRSSFRLCSGLVCLAYRSCRAAQGGWPLRHRQWTPPSAQGAGGERVCLGAYLARRGGISHSQLPQFAECRSGRSHRPHSHLLSSGS